MKKILSVVLALVMIATLGLTAFATATITETSAPSEAEVIVKTSTMKEDGTTPAENYTVTIPATTIIPWEKESTDIEYKIAAQLEWNHRLAITVAGNGVMTFAPDASTSFTLPYALTGDGVDAATNDGPVVLAADAAATKTLNVAIPLDDWKTVPIAEYADLLTFTAEVVAA